MVSSVFGAFVFVFLDLFFFFWGLELGSQVWSFWGVFFGVVLLLLLCGAFRFIVILRHRVLIFFVCPGVSLS